MKKVSANLEITSLNILRNVFKNRVVEMNQNAEDIRRCRQDNFCNLETDLNLFKRG